MVNYIKYFCVFIFLFCSCKNTTTRTEEEVISDNNNFIERDTLPLIKLQNGNYKVIGVKVKSKEVFDRITKLPTFKIEDDTMRIRGNNMIEIFKDSVYHVALDSDSIYLSGVSKNISMKYDDLKENFINLYVDSKDFESISFICKD